MGESKKIYFKIQGKEYVVTGTQEEEDHVQKIAYYVDKKIQQVMAANPSLDIVRATTLVALSFADNLFDMTKTIEKISSKTGIKAEDGAYCEIEKLEKEGIPNKETENS